jgi:hypothetical protein
MDWTPDNALTMQFDSYKVQAVLNEINGLDHSGAPPRRLTTRPRCSPGVERRLGSGVAGDERGSA